MLNGPIWNKLPQFALPVAATAILGQLFNAADVAVVGNFTGAGKTVAVAAVGANSAVIGLIINLFIGIALGCNVVIAHAIGRRDSDAVQRAVHTSVVVAVIGGIIVGLLAGVQSSLFSVSNIVIQSAINSLGTVVMAASSAAFNIEILTFDIIDAFSQACTTFVGQNYGAGKIERCKKTLKLCMLEGLAALVAAIAILLFFGKPLLSIFNNDPKVVETGYIRLMYIMFSHIFNLLYNVMSGYLRGFSISLVPAILTMLGVCGMRIAWIHYVFPLSPTFKTIMIAYPVSLGITALMISATVLYYRPSKRFAGTRDTV